MRLMQRPDQPKHSFCRLPIQIPGRLIGQQNLRLCHQSTCKRHPLLLPTAQLAGPMQRSIPEPDFTQPLLGFGQCLAARKAARQQRHSDIFDGRKLRHQVVELPYVSHVSIAKLCGLPVRQASKSDATNPNLARRRLIECRQQMQQGTLARTRLTDNRNHLPLRDGKTQPGKQLELAMPKASARISLAKAFGMDCCAIHGAVALQERLPGDSRR